MMLTLLSVLLALAPQVGPAAPPAREAREEA